MPRTPALETAFNSYERRFGEISTYFKAIQPCLAPRRDAYGVFAQSIIVLAVADFEDFLHSLVGLAVHHREDALRKYLGTVGKPEQRAQVRNSDLPTLSRIARNHVSFKDQGARIDRFFKALFGCSPWPSEEVRSTVMDLVLVRSFIVHSGSAEVGIGRAGEYAAQIWRAGVLTLKSYSEFHIYRLDAQGALGLYTEAMKAISTLFYRLREQLVANDDWLTSA